MPSCLRQWIIVHFGLITSSLTQSSLSVKFTLKINGKYYLWTIFCCVYFHKRESLLFLHRDMEVSGLVLITLSIITITCTVNIVSIILRAKNEHYGMITLCQPGNSKCCVIAHWIYAHIHRHTHTHTHTVWSKYSYFHNSTRWRKLRSYIKQVELLSV